MVQIWARSHRAAPAFAPVGLLIGAIAGGVLWGLGQSNLSPVLCALLALVVQALITGALHEDALADVADGFGGGGGDKAHTLDIMRDSRIGAFGVLAIVFSVAIRAAALAGIPGPGLAAIALIAAAGFSRGMLPSFMYVMPRARTDGLGAAAGRPTAFGAIIAFALGAIALFVLLPGVVAWPALFISVSVCILVAFWAHGRIGGQTGDVLGTMQQCAEICVLLCAAAWSFDAL